MLQKNLSFLELAKNLVLFLELAKKLKYENLEEIGLIFKNKKTKPFFFFLLLFHFLVIENYIY